MANAVVQSLMEMMRESPQTPQERIEKTRKVRQGVCQIVNRLITDLEKVSEEINRHGSSSPCETLLQLISHCVECFPHIFVYGPHASDLPSFSQQKQGPRAEDQICQNMTFWTLSRLLRILANDGCRILHDKALNTASELVNLLKGKDPYHFHQLMLEIINSLADLTIASDKFFNSDASLDDLTLDRFLVIVLKNGSSQSSRSSQQSTDEVDMSFKPINIREKKECEMLQISMTRLLIETVIDQCTFIPNKLNLLWSTLCCHLEQGNISLKKVSLKACDELCQLNELPSGVVIDYYVDCICALLEKLVADYKEWKEVEETLSGNLASLMQANKSTYSGNQLTTPNMIQLLDTLTNLLDLYGLNTFTQELQQSSVDLITDIYRCLPKTVMFISSMETRRKRLITAVMNEIGKRGNILFICPLLMKEMEFELHQLAPSSRSNSPSADDMIELMDRGDAEPSAKRQKIKAVNQLGDGDMECKVYLLNQLVVKYDLILKSLRTIDLSAEDLEQCCDAILVEGLHLIIDIIVQCCRNPSIESELISRMQLTGKSLFHALIDVGVLCEKIKSLIKCFKNEMYPIASLPPAFTSIVQIFGAILTLPDQKFPTLFSQSVTWILTLPWLPSDMSWLDFKPANSKDIGQLAGKISEKIPTPVICEMIHVLAMMPKEFSPQWRARVMKMAGDDNKEELRCAVIDVFPLLLYHYGPNGNHLVYDILHGILKRKTLGPTEALALAKIYGPLACVISRKAVIHGITEGPLCIPNYKNSMTRCVSCDNIQDDENQRKSPHSRPKFVDPGMFLPFLQLLTYPDKSLKTALVEGFKPLFGHIGVRSNNQSTVDMLNKCLMVVEDPDYNIRVIFSLAIKHLISDGKGDTKSETDQLIITKLRKAYENAKETSNIRLQETILITLGQLGRYAEGELLLVAVVSLLESLLSSVALISAVAYEQIQGVAESKGLKMQVLFMRFHYQICKFLADAMNVAQTQVVEEDSSMKQPLDMLRSVANVFDFSDTKSFLQSTEKCLVPHLVSKASPAATAIIKMLAAEQQQRYKKLLINSTKYIFSYLVRCCEKQELEKALKYLQVETGLEMGSLLRLDYQRVHNELLMYLSTHYSQVFQALGMLASNDETYHGPKNLTTTSDMAEFLQPRLLGILASFDSTLMMSSVPLEEKKLALESLISIMRLMGQKHITAVRVKVMTTLRIGLRFKESGFPDVSCRAWNCFVHSVELTALGPMLSQIVVTLLPLLYQLPKQVAEIFKFLTVENRKLMRHHLHELYFMPDIPELADVNAILKRYDDAAHRKANLSTKISNSLKGVTHESLEVRLHALQKLRQFLHSHQKELREYILGNEMTEPIISQMVSVLLTGCRESDTKARNFFGECLGELGAIDPGRLDLMVTTSQDDRSFRVNVYDSNFTIDLINDLARAYLAAEDTRTQDCSAFAIQELLQIYQISESADIRSPGRKLWNSFAEHIQEILAPLLNSRYILSYTSNWSGLTKPIYHSRKGNNFKNWVCTWTGYLISKVTQEKASKVFQSCCAVIKHNINIALYLLPHILLQALLDGGEDNANEITIEVMEVLQYVIKQDTRQISVSDFRHMSAQTIFSVLDHLFKWKRHRLGLLSAKTAPLVSRDISQDASYINDDHYQRVCDFVEEIPQDLLAHASYNCKAYTRAIMHLEQFLKKNPTQENQDFLQKLYVAMDEPDGVAGVSAIRSDNQTLHEQILLHTSIGQLQDATACYEQAIKLEPEDLSLHQGLLRCFMDLGQLNGALIHASGVVSDRPSWSNELNSFRVEAAWKLAKWDDLEKYSALEKGSSNWGVGLGKILLAAKYKKVEEFYKELQTVRLEQMGPLSAASMEVGSYQRGYEHIVRLHILNDIEQGVNSLLHLGGKDDIIEIMSTSKLFNHWDSRLALTQSSFRTQDPILTVRGIIATLANEEKDVNVEKNIGHCWLQKARVARKAGHVQTAYSSLLSASHFNLPEFWVEKAKWYYHKGDPDQAQAVLEKGVTQHYADWKKFETMDCNESVLEERLHYAKALLLLGRFSDETASVETNKIVKQFRDVIEVKPDWEGGYFHLAKYYDKVMTNMCDTESRPDKKGYLVGSCSQFLNHIILNFGKALQCGNEYIYQSMPRMLTLWLDYGAQVAEEHKLKKLSTGQAQNHQAVLGQLNKLIEEYTSKIQPYQFLTALPQLISRICHAQSDVFSRLMNIISMVIGAYPQQAMWLLMAVSKSSLSVRVKRCHEIFSRAKQQNPPLSKFISDATKLTDRLLDLCNKQVDKEKTLSISHHFKSLKRLVDDKNFSPILLPLQSTMTPSLPMIPGCHSDHNPFPGQQVYLSGFEDTVEVLHSLQKPKKITMRGSDGKQYIMMCKPKDDLRKDCRLMEFNGLINKCLRKDPESRKRNLHIRTYAVIPLNEECGLIEWVPHTHGLRHILLKIYKERGINMSSKDIFKVKANLNDKTEKKLDIFKNIMLSHFPPVFSEWFLRTFPDPTSWYTARLSYARTTAVMSMVGYILGLGDRHGENILFDSTNGDCVHVDLNCLFNKGETFDWPELVPFRLTQNLVEAMGPTGYEGIFRTACEVTMRLMRNEKDSLMSVLRTFIYDPLVEWSTPGRVQNEHAARSKVKANEFGEVKNEMAQTNVQNIEHRLNGILKNNGMARRGLPLSIEGHVNFLIQEAVNEVNLSRMYIGWAAYW